MKPSASGWLNRPDNSIQKKAENNLRLLACRKSPSGFSDRILQSAARIICLPVANKFHTCSLRSVFVHVHAAVKNDFDFIRRIRGELCEAFLYLG